jgi:transcriptional regulator with XRE-family HTH domain
LDQDNFVMNLKDLAQRIRGQREKRGLKQQDVANALNISPQAVSKWERGENAPDIAILAPLGRLLGVSTDWLLAAHDGHRDVFEATVLATSVKGAYERSLGMAPRDFAIWANGLFYTLTEITLRHDGVPIKYMGDRYLSFFSGARNASRGAQAAAECRSVVSEDLRLGLSHGEIYLGSVGHPDYARPDVMGEVVNMAFLTLEWGESAGEDGIAATRAMVEALQRAPDHSPFEEVRFMGIERPVEVCILQQLDAGKPVHD